MTIPVQPRTDHDEALWQDVTPGFCSVMVIYPEHEWGVAVGIRVRVEACPLPHWRVPMPELVLGALAGDVSSRLKSIMDTAMKADARYVPAKTLLLLAAFGTSNPGTEGMP